MSSSSHGVGTVGGGEEAGFSGSDLSRLRVWKMSIVGSFGDIPPFICHSSEEEFVSSSSCI